MTQYVYLMLCFSIALLLDAYLPAQHYCLIRKCLVAIDDERSYFHDKR